MNENENLIARLRERARIRRQVETRKSVQEGKPDRIADLLEEAAAEIERLTSSNKAERNGRLGLTKDELSQQLRSISIMELRNHPTAARAVMDAVDFIEDEK